MKSHFLFACGTKLVVIFLVFAMTLNPVQVSAAPFPGPAPLPSVVKIGVIYPISGRLVKVNHWGDEAKPFWRQAEVDINNLPDAISQKIAFQLIVESSDSTAAGAQKAAQTLINTYGVQAIVGLPVSYELTATIADLTKYQIATISSGSTGPNLILRQPDTVYRIMPGELYLAHKMSDMVMELGYTKAAIIYRTDDWGEMYAKVFADHFQALGNSVDFVPIEPTHPYVKDYAVEVADLSTKVSKFGAGSDTAVIMVVWEGEDLNILHHAAKDKALSSVRWFSAAAGPALLTGEFGSSLSLPDASDFAFDRDLWTQENHPPQNRLAGRLLSYAEQQLGRQPRYEHMYLYDAIQLMARAILLAGTYDGASIAAQIPKAAQTYSPATGFIHFDINGDRNTGDLAYPCMVPSSGDYEYQYCAYSYGDARSRTFDILSTPEPRDIEWCVEC